LRILNVVGAFPPAFAEGGPGVMVYNVSRELIQLGHQVFVLTTDKCVGERLDVPRGETEWNGVQVRYCLWERSFLPYHSPELRAQVRARLPRTDVVLLSSSWTSYGIATGTECRRAGTPYILYAHGSYDPARLRRGWLKKKFWWWAFDRRLYDHAAAVIALTKAEVEQIRTMRVKTRTDQIPIGVDTVQLTVRTSRAELEERYPELRGHLIVLFLGRLHPIKGVDVLIKSFARVRLRVPKALLVIAGPSEGSYAEEIYRFVRDQNLEDAVLLTGEVRTLDKASLLHEAAVFCLTSYGEGLPAAALEAMYCGTPVVLSEGCNLPEIEEVGAGYVTNLDPHRVADAIITLLQDDKAREQMGENGRRLVSERFTWREVARKTAALCEDILDS